MQSIKPKRTLVDEVYEILVDAICLREFEPGERLNQDEIASRLNVSRQPVNSAIAILKADNLVEDTGRRGVIVTPIDPDLSASIYEYRMVIEPFAIELAAEHLPEDARIEADRVLEEGRNAVARAEIRALLQADCAFHEMIYAWSRNRVIQKSMQVAWNHLRRDMAEVLRDETRAERTWEEHAAIIDALMVGDGKGAAELMRDHLRNAHERRSNRTATKPIA
jgi:DNA-binding GntR family transcriptional regulator